METKKEQKTLVNETKETSKVDNKSVVSTDVQKLIQKIEKMTVLQLNDFVKALQDHFKINPANLSFGNQGNSSENQGKTSDEVEVIIKEVGPSKIALIKLVAKLTGKGLLDAKKMVDVLPLSLGKKKEEAAKKLQSEIEEIGAVVELK